jgi:hypothetical protein
VVGAAHYRQALALGLSKLYRAAGIIWRYLNEHGEVTLSKLRQATKLSDHVLFAGIGWLAREEKLRFTTEGRSVRVCLREHQPA